MTPKRIQRNRSKGWRMPKNAIYVGRPTKWGNPFKCGDPFPYDHSKPIASVQESVDIYESYIRAGLFRYTQRRIIIELKGKDLACWCNLEKPCHADVLLKLANES